MYMYARVPQCRALIADCSFHSHLLVQHMHSYVTPRDLQGRSAEEEVLLGILEQRNLTDVLGDIQRFLYQRTEVGYEHEVTGLL